METSNQQHQLLLQRQKVKKSRFYIDNEFLERGYAAKFRKLHLLDIYCALARRANYKTQRCFPSYEDIMELTGLKNKNAVAVALRKLEELNIIFVYHSKGRRSNQYILQDVEVWLKPDGSTYETVIQYQTNRKVDRIWYRKRLHRWYENSYKKIIKRVICMCGN